VSGEADGPRPLGESLDRLAKSVAGRDAGYLAGLFMRWPELVGEQLAQHCRPASLRGEVLWLAADEPGWAAQIRYLEADLLGRIRVVLGEPAPLRIEVRVER